MSTTPQSQFPTPVPLPELTVQAGGAEPIPLGSYFASFQSVDAFSLSHKGIEGTKLRWVFTVESGKEKGKTISALTDAKITDGTHGGRLVAGMLGRQPKVGESINPFLDELKGKRFLCVYSAGPKGGKPSVQSVSLPPEM